jgi:DNA polymerase III delta subunit
LYKFLEKEATVKAFEPLSFGELKNFVREHTSLVLDNDVLEYFLAKVGTDLYHVLHECEKLHVWCTIHNIQIVTKEVVDTVNFGLVESNGFDFFDTYFVNQKKCLSVIGKVQDE